jgi:hypothetical protein
MAAAAAIIDIVARDRASDSFRRVGDAAGGAGDSAKKSAAGFGFLGGVVGGFAVSGLAAVKDWAGGAVDAFAAVEDATAAAGVQFGGATDQVVKFAEDAAKNFGLSKQAALDAQNEFGTFGKAAGLQEAELAKFSQGLTGLAGDLASFKGTSTEQAINAIGGALRGETEGMRAYGVLLSADAIAAEALSSGLVKANKDMTAIKAAKFAAEEAQRAYNKAVKEHGEDSKEAEKAQIALEQSEKRLGKAMEGNKPQLTDQAKLMATQQLIYKATGDAQGDYARTSTSTANTQKTLEAETLNAQAALGAKLAPALTFVRNLKLQLIRTVTDLIAKIDTVVGFVRSNQTTFVVLAGIVGAVVIPALIRMGVQAAIAGTQMVVSAAKQAAAWVMLGIQSNLAAIKIAASWLIAIGPVALVIAAVVGLVVLVVKNWDKIKDATAAAWKWVTRKVGDSVEWLKNLFLNFTGPGLIIKHFDKIVAAVKGMPGKIADVARGMFDGIKDAFRGAINFVIDAWNGLEFRIPGFDPPGPGPKIGGFTLGVPDIPRLAEGGIVDRPTVALIGEAGPEAVIPLSRGGGRLGGGNVYVDARGALDPVAVGREVDKALRAFKQSGGQLVTG